MGRFSKYKGYRAPMRMYRRGPRISGRYGNTYYAAIGSSTINNTAVRSLLGKLNTKLSYVYTQSSDASGYILINNAVRDPSSSADWSPLAAIFDSYKVTGYKVEFQPHVPPGNSLTFDYQAFYAVFDKDNGSSTPSYSKQFMVDYANHKFKNVFKPWKIYYKVPRYIDGAGGLQDGYNNTASPVANGRFYGYAEGLDASLVIGDIVITWYVSFKNRR